MITLDDVRAALAVSDDDILQQRLAMSPVPRGFPTTTPPRKAGVLALLYPYNDTRLHVLLTRRNENLRGHSGQVSFPGGKRDDSDPDYTSTALRETCEEIGICGGIEILGRLTQIYIPPSNYNVYPSVGYLPSLPTLSVNEAEVSQVLSFALDDLLDPISKQSEMRDIQGYRVSVPYYLVEGHKVWGATAIMLGELELRLRVATSTFL